MKRFLTYAGLGGILGYFIANGIQPTSTHIQPSTTTQIVQQSEQQPTQQQSLEQLLSQPVEQTVQYLSNNYDIPISPEELIYMTRLVYFEGLDPKAKRAGELDKAFALVAHNIRDRYQWDKTHPNVFSKEGTIENIIFNKNKKGSQYSSTHDKADQFTQKSLTQDGKYSVKTPIMTRKETQLAYRIVLETLVGEQHDLPENILYFINPELNKQIGGRSDIQANAHAFTYFDTSCDTIRLPGTSEALERATAETANALTTARAKASTKRPNRYKCRVEDSYSIQPIEGLEHFYNHDLFTVQPTRTEYVWHNGRITKEHS